MIMPAYQVGILGKPDGRETTLATALYKRLAELGVDRASVVTVPETDVGKRDRKRPFIGVFFGYLDATDTGHLILKDLLEDSVVMVPIVSDLSSVSSFIPQSLRHINALALSPADPSLERVVTLLLENFRLLRPDRRLFISYRRVEAQRIAIQLYEKLDALGFDVFLDTRGVPPAADFQNVLWHRLADSDVVVLLDTPGFRASRWTREELARANATNIQILHFLWPGASPDGTSAFSEFHELNAGDFITADQVGENARLHTVTVDMVGALVESLRARALAARHRYLVDNFCDQARSLGKNAVVQSSRFIALELTNSKSIAVVPAVGVPNAIRYQEIEKAITDSGSPFEKIWLLYDERGLLESWLAHVEWLNRHLPLSAVRVSESSARIEAEAI